MVRPLGTEGPAQLLEPREVEADVKTPPQVTVEREPIHLDGADYHGRLLASNGKTRAEIAGVEAPPRRIELHGTVRIDGTEEWTNAHVRIHGDLEIAPGGSLKIEDACVEICGAAARDHQIRIAGTLISKRSTIGGTAGDQGPIQTCINLSGSWLAEDTTVQYSYGIMADAGTLSAQNLKAGPFPDSILMSGSAAVSLRDSQFAIALYADAGAGGQYRLSLPSNRPIHRVFDSARVPGAPYRLELENVEVPQWFLFVRGISAHAPKTEIQIRDATNLVPSMMAHDLRGELHLPASWKRSGDLSTWGDPLPAGTRARAGNVELEIGTPMLVPGWGVYLTGSNTDARIRGPTAIAELFVQQGARCDVEGTPGTHDTLLQCTTTDVTDGGRLFVRDAMLGWFARSALRGQLRAERGGTIIARRIHAADLGIVQDQNSFVSLEDLSGPGRITVLDQRPAFVSSAVREVQLSPRQRRASLWVGAAIEVGDKPLFVNRLGRAHIEGNSGKHELRLIRASDRATLAAAEVSVAGARDRFAYAFTPQTVRLEPRERYYLLSRESEHGDSWLDFDTAVTTRPELRMVGPVWSEDLKVFNVGGGSTAYGPVDMQYWDARF
jgi:hypothetical protein